MEGWVKEIDRAEESVIASSRAIAAPWPPVGGRASVVLTCISISGMCVLPGGIQGKEMGVAENGEKARLWKRRRTG